MSRAAEIGVLRCRIGEFDIHGDDEVDAAPERGELEGWVNALVQADHLSLLVGNGLSISMLQLAGGEPSTMSMNPVVDDLEEGLAQAINKAANESAQRMGRADKNIEDWLHSAIMAEAGMRTAGHAGEAGHIEASIVATLDKLVADILAAEHDLAARGPEAADGGLPGYTVQGVLVAFLLALASRPSSRDRLHIFTTNYDRLIEWGLELAGLRIVDRFVGTLAPRFRSSRLDIDLHYNPPGLRGEPRALDGVVRLSKIHGSLDWRWDGTTVVRAPITFGAQEAPPPGAPMIFPNAAKDLDTAFYPYADLFRDFSAAVCRPNSVLITFGYGFGDGHLNRVLADMLTIPSTHLLILSFDDVGGRIGAFERAHHREGQISALMGSHFGSITGAVQRVLPRPAADQVLWRRAKLLQDLHVPTPGHSIGEEHE